MNFSYVSNEFDNHDSPLELLGLVLFKFISFNPLLSMYVIRDSPMPCPLYVDPK